MYSFFFLTWLTTRPSRNTRWGMDGLSGEEGASLSVNVYKVKLLVLIQLVNKRPASPRRTVSQSAPCSSASRSGRAQTGWRPCRPSEHPCKEDCYFCWFGFKRDYPLVVQKLLNIVIMFGRKILSVDIKKCFCNEVKHFHMNLCSKRLICKNCQINLDEKSDSSSDL